MTQNIVLTPTAAEASWRDRAANGQSVLASHTVPGTTVEISIIRVPGAVRKPYRVVKCPNGCRWTAFSESGYDSEGAARRAAREVWAGVVAQRNARKGA